jgi:hypothetical protein
MRELIAQALEVAERHRKSLIPAIVAELELLSLGFDAVRFTSRGLTAARYMNIWYPLEEVRDEAR